MPDYGRRGRVGTYFSHHQAAIPHSSHQTGLETFETIGARGLNDNDLGYFGSGNSQPATGLDQEQVTAVLAMAEMINNRRTIG